MATCKDCKRDGITSARPAPHPGPRCVTHHRAEKKRRSARAHALRTEATYRITGEEYQALYASQGGRCYICERATGKTKRLAVDHDHHKGCGHDPKTGCRNCVRALLCGPCNQMLGTMSPKSLARAITVLVHPPAQAVLAITSTEGNN